MAALVLGIPNLANLGGADTLQSVAFIWCSLVAVVLIAGLPYWSSLRSSGTKLIFDSVYATKPVDLQLYIDSKHPNAERKQLIAELRAMAQSHLPGVVNRLNRARDDYREKAAVSDNYRIESYLVQRLLSRKAALTQFVGLPSVASAAAVSDVELQTVSRTDVPILLHPHNTNDSMLVSEVD